MIQAVILAGGLGTRLQPVLKDRPKVLAPVQNRPFLGHLLEQLLAAGIRHTVLLTGHAAGQVRQVLGDCHLGMKLTYSTEKSPQGTAGALRLALPHLETETLLLMNGDSYCKINFADLLARHRDCGADLTMTLSHSLDTGRFGKVAMAEDGRLTDFSEKQEGAGAGWINAGIYAMEKALVNEIPPGQFLSLEADLLPGWINARHLYGFPAQAPFLDIGTPASYASAESFFHG